MTVSSPYSWKRPPLTARQVGERLGISPRTARRRYRELGGVRVGHQYRFPQERLEEALRVLTEEGRPE